MIPSRGRERFSINLLVPLAVIMSGAVTNRPFARMFDRSPIRARR